MKFEFTSDEASSYLKHKNKLVGGEFDLPTRSTECSAGYDFHSPYGFKIKKHQTIKMPLNVRLVDMPKNSVLLITNRSSLSLKYGITIDNAIGVIDSDFNKTIWLQITNNGKKTYQVNINDKICQGIIMNYITTDDDIAKGTRNGGIGSTGK